MRTNNLSKEELNLLVRRTDGRFLTNNPYPEKSICFAEGALAASVEFISESVIYTPSCANDCDFAISTNPDLSSLSSAWLALKPGGSIYIEWHVNRFFNPQLIRDKLERVKFCNIELYLPRPNPDISPTKIWISLESNKVIEFWSKKRFSSSHSKFNKRIELYLKKSFTTLGSAIFKKYPWLLIPSFKNFIICSTAQKPLESDNISISNNQNLNKPEPEVDKISSKELTDSVSSDSSIYGRSSSKLMATTGSAAENHAILYLFSTNENEPSTIVKMSRIVNSSERLLNEANILKTLEEKYKNLDVSPKLLFVDCTNGFYSFGQTYFSGITLDRVLTTNNFRELSFKVTELLADVAANTRSKAPYGYHDKFIEPIISKFVNNFGSALDPILIHKTKEILDGLEVSHLVCAHRDLSSRNLIINSDGKLGIVDWELCVLQSLPLTDLIYFLTYSNTDLKNGWHKTMFVVCYRDLLDETTNFGRVFKDCINYYCDSVGIPTCSVPKFRLLLWIITLNRKYDEIIQYDNGNPTKELLRNILQIGLWEEEVHRSSKTIG